MKPLELHAGEKIKLLRLARNVSQEQLAIEVGFARTSLSAVENNHIECPPEVQWSMRQYLEVQEIPFSELERNSFKEKLYAWYKIIGEDHLELAKELNERYSVIKLLPEDAELNAYYGFFSAKYLLKVNKVSDAQAIVTALEEKLETFDPELMYHYYFTKGTLCYKLEDGTREDGSFRKQSLDYYLKAMDLIGHVHEDKKTLAFNIASSLSLCGYALNTILFIKDNFNVEGVQVTRKDYDAENMLAVNYIRIGWYSKAKVILDRHLRTATLFYDKANALLNLGYLYRMRSDWTTAIMYIDNAISFIDDKTSPLYLEAIYLKTRCLIAIKDRSKSTALIAEGLRIAEDRNNIVYNVLFTSMEVVSGINDTGVSYLEETTIPFLVNTGAYSRALDFCNLALVFYENKIAAKKSMTLERTISSIYKNMIGGGELG